MTNFIFVYGTLKKGFCNHHIIKDCEFKGIGFTLPKFRMFDIGYPYVVFSSKGFSIKGEIYKINNKKTWEDLDKLEDYPIEYGKKEIKIILNANIINAVIYYYKEIVNGNEIKKIKFNDNLKLYYIEWPL